MASRLKVSEGDWICPDKKCGNVNFARRNKCNRCGIDKGHADLISKTGAEIGKAIAAKSKGLFSADDWQCKRCGNINWARRNECNVCNTPKFNKQEARTGLGGGFKERDDYVEYKEHNEEEDEYDEFGRRKKKFRGSLQSSGSLEEFTKQQTEKSNQNGEDGEEDEEDDDDDDVDLSKYELDGDDDEEDEEEDGDLSKYDLDASDDDSKEEPNSVNSRSRSPSPKDRPRKKSRSRSNSPPKSRSRSRSPHRSTLYSSGNHQRERR